MESKNTGFIISFLIICSCIFLACATDQAPLVVANSLPQSELAFYSDSFDSLKEDLWEKAGYDLNDVFELIGLDIKMFYGGPSEAIMHAVYRQNYGFSDLVIGRKHADAPFEDGSPIWGDFDAQEVFDDLAGDLKIRPLRVGFAAFYESMGRVDLMENHPDEKPVFISGKQVRKCLQEGEPVDPRIMRKSTAKILTEAMAGT